MEKEKILIEYYLFLGSLKKKQCFFLIFSTNSKVLHPLNNYLIFWIHLSEKFHKEKYLCDKLIKINFLLTKLRNCRKLTMYKQLLQVIRVEKRLLYKSIAFG